MSYLARCPGWKPKSMTIAQRIRRFYLRYILKRPPLDMNKIVEDMKHGL
jgi:hypothetical protein